MTRDAIETAVREGIPFVINMADGKSCEVRDEFKIAVGATRVVVLDDRDLPHLLPLLTMTGICRRKMALRHRRSGNKRLVPLAVILSRGDDEGPRKE